MSKVKSDSAVATLVRSDATETGEAVEAAERQRQEFVLRQLYERLVNEKESALAAGMLAQWKPGLKNRVSPAYGEPVIVVGLVNPPIVDDSFESGSCYFRESLSVLIGAADEDGELLVHHCDIRRFEPYAGNNG